MPSYRPTIKVPRTPCAPNQPQYEFLCHFFRSNLSHPFSAVCKLPDELFLSILSHAYPGPQFAGQYARFRIQYCMQISYDHGWRVRFLRQLSMTCKAMRLRLLPWIWGDIAPSLRCYCYTGTLSKGLQRNFNTILRTSYADAFLASSVNTSAPFFVPGLG